jgi:hypothetical protein
MRGEGFGWYLGQDGGDLNNLYIFAIEKKAQRKMFSPKCNIKLYVL